MKLSVLVPVFNEAPTIRESLSRVLAIEHDFDLEVICVDDGSADESLSILREIEVEEPRIKVVSHQVNMGKGRAIRTARDHVTGDVVIVQDADLEYDPSEYPIMLRPILEGRADAVFGSRFAAREQRRVLFFWHSLGNKLLTTLSNMVNNLNLTDMETCYKAVRADLFTSLRLTSDRFGFEPEITSRLARARARIYEVPISYYGRTYDEGKKIGWRDGLEALWLILKFRFLDTRALDDAGRATLESMAEAPQVSQWMLSNFEPYLGERILEAGGGTGNLTGFLANGKTLTIIDIDEQNCEMLKEQYRGNAAVEVITGSLEDASTYEGTGPFETVICVNVLEHLDSPDVALRHFHDVVTPGGHVGLLVPAHEWLFSAADTALGHRMRYTKRKMRHMLSEAGFDVVECHEFNRLGVAGWAANKLIRRQHLGRRQMRIFNRLVPFARRLEKVTVLPGLSVVAVARRPD